MAFPRVLILAETCNPQWPSLPIVGYKYARALMGVCNATLATHPRNRENIEAAGDIPADRIRYIDTEWLAGPMYRLARILRGGDEVAWSTNQMMSYPPYIAFEKQARKVLREEHFDLVHRITPMSPTLPSYLSGRAGVPMILGPLNGNLDWPAAFKAEQRREREMLRKLRGLYRYLPYSRSSAQKAAAILAAFQHTMDDLNTADPSRVVPMPEIGFDPSLFHSGTRAPAFSGEGPYTFLFAGRLVPYKVPEVVIRAFSSSDTLRAHRLRILGDGPEMSRLQAMVVDANAEDRITFEGNKSQAEVAEVMRQADAFVFPSIRELGAGVVIEAMASGALCIVTDYGAPGDLAANGRGIRVPLATLEEMVGSYRAALEHCLNQSEKAQARAARAREYALKFYTWEAKASYTARVYEAVLSGDTLDGFTDYL